MIHTLTGVIGTEKGAVSADVAMLRVTGKQVVAGDVLTLELASPSGAAAAGLVARARTSTWCCPTA